MMAQVDYAKAVRCASLSKAIYDALDQLQFDGFASRPHPIQNASTDTQGAIASEPTHNEIYIVFRGSAQERDWGTNFQFNQQVIQPEILAKQNQNYPYEAPSKSGAKMHSGFTAAYQSVRSDIHGYLSGRLSDDATVIVTGHSLGGAIATLCAVDIQYNFGDRLQPIELYTFGAPKIGNAGFRTSFNERVANSYRFVNGLDIVPALPRPWQGYNHIDREYRLGQRFSWRFFSKRFTDHNIDQYITALKALQ